MSLEPDQYAVKEAYIASGKFGDVHRVKRISDSRVLACKTIRYDKVPEGRLNIEEEVKVLSRLHHPNIVHYYKVIWLRREAKIYTEFCDGENLDDYIQNNNRQSGWPAEAQLWNLTLQLSAALLYCHHGLYRNDLGRKIEDHLDDWNKPWPQVLHRDIKPHNVFVSFGPNDEVIYKLGDFGLATILSDEHTNMAFGGTFQYIAPEVREDDPAFSVKSDIYALGCTLYYFIRRRTPFSGQMSVPEPLPALPERFSPLAKEWLWKCIAFKATDRPDTIELFTEASSHLKDQDLKVVSVRTPATFLGGPNTQPSQSTSPMNQPIATGTGESQAPFPTRQTADSFYETNNDQGNTYHNVYNIGSGSTTMTSHGPAPRNLSSPSSSNINDFGIGNFVVDILRFPPLEAFRVRGKTANVTSNHITEDIEFFDLQPMPSPKDNKASIFSFWKHSSPPPFKQVRTSADGCDEHLLQEFDLYFDELTNAKNGNTEPRVWLDSKFQRSNHPVYLLVGCLTYENARVDEKILGSTGGTYGMSVTAMATVPAVAGGVPLSPNPATTMSASSFTSDPRRMYIMKGTRVQAAYFVEIRRTNYSTIPDSPSIFTLGERKVVYYWGPKKPPLQDIEATIA